jgi:hypothetical protein
MAKQFLHIAFKFANGDPKTATLRPIFNKAIDWFRYAPNCWIVWTSSSADKWYERLKPHIDDEDSMLIVKIDMTERQGWLNKSLWEWMDKHHSEE